MRRFTQKKIPKEVLMKAFEEAILAPNSSNTQTWRFYWVNSHEKKENLVAFCLNQSAARTCSDLIVCVASPKSWKISQPELIKYTEEIVAPSAVVNYYKKLVPMMYQWGPLNSWGLLKKILFTCLGIFKPVPRSPGFRSEVQEVAIKSSALACENFVLSLTNQGFASCMMEGFDEARVKKLLKLNCSDRVVMVIAAGEEAQDGTWGPRFRIKLSQVVHEV